MNRQYCTKCGKKNDRDARFCIQCGFYLLDKTYCTSCGALIGKNRQTCPQCDEPNPVYDASQNNLTNKIIKADQTFSKIMIPFAVIFVLMGLGVILVFILVLLRL